MFSYKVLPVDSYAGPDNYVYHGSNNDKDITTPSIIINQAPATSYVTVPAETFPVENFTVYQDPLTGDSSPGKHHHEYSFNMERRDDLHQTETGMMEHNTYDDYYTGAGAQARPLYEYEMPLALEPLDIVEPVIPPIRFLYSDDCNDDISIQLQIADHQSSLGWGDVVRIVEPMIRLPSQPIDIVEQVTTLILMEEQVTETVFRSIKHIIWNKLSRFIQVRLIIDN